MKNQCLDQEESNAIDRLVWYKHDGTPPHFTAPVLQFLNASSSNRWIERRSQVEWPPQSPK